MTSLVRSTSQLVPVMEWVKERCAALGLPPDAYLSFESSVVKLWDVSWKLEELDAAAGQEVRERLLQALPRRDRAS